MSMPVMDKNETYVRSHAETHPEPLDSLDVQRVSRQFEFDLIFAFHVNKYICSY
jgi:hypothetical protein